MWRNITRNIYTIVFILVMSITALCSIHITTANAAQKKITVTVQKAKNSYTGKTVKPKVVVKYGKTTIKKSNYTVKYNNKKSKNPGKYKVTVTLKKNYKKSIKKRKYTAYYYIAPKKPSNVKYSVDKNTNKITVSYKGSKVTGYQVQLSTSSFFDIESTSPLDKVTLRSSKTSYTYDKSGITGDTSFFIRVRTYKKYITSGKTIKLYSSWVYVNNRKGITLAPLSNDNSDTNPDKPNNTTDPSKPDNPTNPSDKEESTFENELKQYGVTNDPNKSYYENENGIKISKKIINITTYTAYTIAYIDDIDYNKGYTCGRGAYETIGDAFVRHSDGIFYQEDYSKGYAQLYNGKWVVWLSCVKPDSSYKIVYKRCTACGTTVIQYGSNGKVLRYYECYTSLYEWQKGSIRVVENLIEKDWNIPIVDHVSSADEYYKYDFSNTNNRTQLPHFHINSNGEEVAVNNEAIFY